MSKYYQTLDEGHFDYGLVGMPDLPIVVRGPRIDPSKPYIACVGASQVFGRFCEHPFPALLGEELGLPCLNLGVGGVGPAFFNRSPFLNWLNAAELVVVQVLSGRSEGNSFFDNSARLGLHGTSRLDGREVRFEEFLADLVREWPPRRVLAVVEETRRRYLANASSLLDNIDRPKVVLWLSRRSPEYTDDPSSASGILGGFPHLINRAILESLRPHAEALVECTSNAGYPQELWPAREAIDGARLIRGRLFNEYYPSPEIHREVAVRLAPVCRQLISQNESAGARSERRSTLYPPRRFIILGAERSGTNLVRELLASHPEVVVGGELFNYELIRRKEVHWWAALSPGVDELDRLRASDPKAFVELLFETSRTPVRRAVGFKVMYSHADIDRRVREFLVRDTSFRIVHVKRRNLLRRFLSQQRAIQTDKWWVGASEPTPTYPRVTLTAEACVADFSTIENWRAEYDESLKGHDVLDLWYEDTCADPRAARSRMLRFLGLPEAGSLAIPSRKTGTDRLRDAIENYDELKAALLDRAHFFDD